jgi:hypothetical protein
MLNDCAWCEDLLREMNRANEWPLLRMLRHNWSLTLRYVRHCYRQHPAERLVSRD